MAHTLIDTYLEPADGAECFVIIDSGIDNTYPVYEIHYVNIHPETDDTSFQFQVETGTDSDYDHPMTTTFSQAWHKEDGSDAGLGYSGGNDQATLLDGNGVFSKLAKDMGADGDQAISGILTLYDPSSAFVKHFVSTSHGSQNSDYAQSAYVAGYINTTTPITRVKFMMSSGDISSGTIKMFGVS